MYQVKLVIMQDDTRDDPRMSMQLAAAVGGLENI